MDNQVDVEVNGGEMQRIWDAPRLVNRVGAESCR